MGFIVFISLYLLKLININFNKLLYIQCFLDCSLMLLFLSFISYYGMQLNESFEEHVSILKKNMSIVKDLINFKEDYFGGKTQTLPPFYQNAVEKVIQGCMSTNIQ